MKQGFVRTFWGINNNKDISTYSHKSKMYCCVELSLRDPYKTPFICYTFGEDNHKYLIDKGVNSILIDKRPYVWSGKINMFRHKLEALKIGSEEFDEMVFLDWDTLQIAPLPTNFWDEQRKKKPIQMLLRSFVRKRFFWRPNKWAMKLVLCASYVYLRDKQVSNGIIKTWENLGEETDDEIAIARYIDDIESGWKNENFWWDNYETMFFYLHKGRMWSRERQIQKQVVFSHYNSRQIYSKLSQFKEKE